MYTEIDCCVRHFNDAGSQDVLFAPSNLETAIAFSNMKEQVSNKFEIAASGSLALTYGSVGAPKGLYILCEGDANVDITIGLITLTIPIRRSSSTVAKENVPLLIPAATSAVTISNPGTSTLIGRYDIWGDPA